MSIGGHHNPVPKKTVWLTPPEITIALGGYESFDLDPCSLDPRPWSTALHHIAPPLNGLAHEWFGRVWLNPPYTATEIGEWLRRMAEHNHGTALIFARTDTQAFMHHVWQKADSLLFLYGRLNFHHASGFRALKNSGAPSVLCAYGPDDTERLAASRIKGHFVPLRLSRGIVCMMWSQLPSWSEAVYEWIGSRRGTISLSDIYAAFENHPKAKLNQHWRAKIRQTLQKSKFERVAQGKYCIKMDFANTGA